MRKFNIMILVLILSLLSGCYKPPTIEDVKTCGIDQELIGGLCVDIVPDIPDDVWCADNEVLHGVCIDKTKPVILGALNGEIGRYSEFDPLDGVTAEDDVDGVITDGIVVESFVDSDQYGEYIVKYTVSDAAGNTTSVIRYVEVVYIPIEGEVIELALNGTFDQGLAGWDIFNNSSGGNAVFTVVDGVLEIDVVSVPDSYFWVPRISYSGMTIESGKTYEVQFDIWADDERMFHLQVGELLNGEPWFTDFRPGAGDKIIYISTEKTTVSRTFTMNLNTNLNGGVTFEFGHVGDVNLLTTIYLDNLSVKEVMD